MWIALWLVISAFILGVFVWSTRILLQQKNAWQSYAKKHGYDYKAGKFMEPPTISGTISDMRLSLYTDIQRTNDVRGERYVTVIEMVMGSGLPTGAILATPELQPFVDSLTFTESYAPDNYSDWKPAYLVKTRDTARLKPYLTKDRLEILHRLFSMKNSVTMLFFDEQECVLRIETSDPLRRAEHLEKIVKRIIDCAQKLKPTAEEKEKFTKNAAPPSQPEQAQAMPQPAATQEETPPSPPNAPEDETSSG